MAPQAKNLLATTVAAVAPAGKAANGRMILYANSLILRPRTIGRKQALLRLRQILLQAALRPLQERKTLRLQPPLRLAVETR
jgi:hypothetical protein